MRFITACYIIAFCLQQSFYAIGVTKYRPFARTLSARSYIQGMANWGHWLLLFSRWTGLYCCMYVWPCYVSTTHTYIVSVPNPVKIWMYIRGRYPISINPPSLEIWLIYAINKLWSFWIYNSYSIWRKSPLWERKWLSWRVPFKLM